MTQKERINILNILERLGAEIGCIDCIFYDECISEAECIYDKAHDLIENDDAKPVVHGHWVSINADESGYAALYRCSVCQREISLGYFDTDCDHEYCLHCGAKMDEQ